MMLTTTEYIQLLACGYLSHIDEVANWSSHQSSCEISFLCLHNWAANNCICILNQWSVHKQNYWEVVFLFEMLSQSGIWLALGELKWPGKNHQIFVCSNFHSFARSKMLEIFWKKFLHKIQEKRIFTLFRWSPFETIQTERTQWISIDIFFYCWYFYPKFYESLRIQLLSLSLSLRLRFAIRLSAHEHSQDDGVNNSDWTMWATRGTKQWKLIAWMEQNE